MAANFKHTDFRLVDPPFGSKLNTLVLELDYLRNIFDKTYMAFTEPDPDGNSYQPGPGYEIF